MIHIHLKIHRSCRQSRGCFSKQLMQHSVAALLNTEAMPLNASLACVESARAPRRAPNALYGRANEAFKVIVSCLMCDGQDKPRLCSFI